MSLVCKMEKCKAKQGMCNCEKTMAALAGAGLVAAAVAFLKRLA